MGLKVTDISGCDGGGQLPKAKTEEALGCNNTPQEELE